MDNDNKVNLPENKRHNEVLLFLNKELSKLQDQNTIESYNLEHEFAKTKKNHNKSVLIILLSSFLAVVILATAISFSLTKSNNNLTISMNSFDDLNLKSLIDSVSSAQNNYDNAVKNKISLEVNLESAIKSAETQRENDIFILDSLKLKSKTEYKERLNKIETDYQNAVSKAHEDYDVEISTAAKEIELYQEQLKQFDAAKIQAAQEQQKALDSERELRLLEQKKITDKYDAQISKLENKITELTRKNTSDMHKALQEMTEHYEEEIRTLDPVIYDENGNKIVADVTSSQTITFNVKDFASKITSDTAAEALEKYEQYEQDYEYLEDTIKKIPYKNSVPSYLSASRILVNKMNEAFAETATEINNQKLELEKENKKLQLEVENQKLQVQKIKQEREEDLQGIEDTLEALLTTVKASGVILSATSADNIRVYVGLKYRELITDEGISAEVKGTKAVKGMIVKQENGFYLVPAVDKNGNLVEIDVSAILPGSVVKVIVK